MCLKTLKRFMRKKKITKIKVEKAPEVKVSGMTLEQAEGRLARFQGKRDVATTIEDIKKNDFWIAHWKKFIKDFE